MTEIRNRKEFEDWLNVKPVEVARVVTLRMALRLLPLTDARPKGLVLTAASLRALYISWAAGSWPAHEMFIVAAHAAHAANDAANSAFASFTTAALAAYAAAAAARTRCLDALAPITAADATDFAFAVETDYATATWKNLEADASWIDAQSDADVGAEPRELLNGLLWQPLGTDSQQLTLWRDFRTELETRNEDWLVWIEWYERRLRGDRLGWDIDPMQNEALCIALALESNEFWGRSPAEVNADIRERVEAARLPPAQDMSVGQFELDDARRIMRAPLPDKDRLNDTAPQRDHYAEFLKSFGVLAALSGNELGPVLKGQVDDLGEVLTPAIEDLNRHLFWPRFARLRKTMARHERAQQSTEHSTHRLDPDTADDLREVVNNGNIVIANQPNLLLPEQQAMQPLPSEEPPPPAEISRLVDQTARDVEITERDAGRDVTIANEAARETATPADVPAARSGTRVLGNYVTMLVERGRQMAAHVGKKVGDVAIGEAAKAFFRLLWDNRGPITIFLMSLAPEIGKWAARILAILAQFL